MASSARSASYAGGKTSASQSRKTTVGATIDRRVERNTVQTREYFTVRSKSPVKQADQPFGTKRSREPEKPPATKLDGKPKESSGENSMLITLRILV
jgi:hypothetical protein